MSILGKILWKKKNENIQTSSSNPEYQEDWTFYIANVNDKLTSISVDLGFAKIAPIIRQKDFLWISIKMNDPKSDSKIDVQYSYQPVRIYAENLFSWALVP